MKKKSKRKLIKSLQKRFNLFQAPNRMGDIIEYQENEYLIIGIEKVKLEGKALAVVYTCQNLTIMDVHDTYTDMTFRSEDNNLVEFYVKIDLGKRLSDPNFHFKQRENLLPIGAIFENEGRYFKWLIYTDLKMEFTTLEIRALAEEIKPIAPEDARKHLLDYKREKIGLSII